MHGVCLHRRCSVLELKALWWANVATRVPEQYQSFFPPDVRFVADYAKQAIGSFPLSTGRYYGVDYGKPARSGALLQAIYDYSLELEAAEPKIGSVATSLPVMLLFEEDMGLRNPDRGILPSCAGLVRVWANGHGQTASGDSTPRGSQSRRSCRSASESRRRCFGIVPRVRRYLSQYFELRADVFNLTNSPLLGQPGDGIGQSGGQITTARQTQLFTPNGRFSSRSRRSTSSSRSDRAPPLREARPVRSPLPA